LAGVCLAFLTFAVQAQEERTAGTMPVSKPRAQKENTLSAETAADSTEQDAPAARRMPVEEVKKEKVPEPEPALAPAEPAIIKASTEISDRPVKQLSRANFRELESYGLLTNASDGGLGIDLWQDSNRETLLNLIQIMPADLNWRTTQSLVRRALLTRTDMGFMKGGSNAEPGNDFLTVRIEKLTDMGNFSEAVKLYTANPDKPYHERLAKAGIMAMLYGGDTSLACLEESALKSELPDSPFWQQISGLCAYYMAKMVGAQKDVTVAFEGSSLLRKVIEKENFRYSIHNAKNFEPLSPLEKAALIGDGRIDYSSLRPVELRDFSPLSSAIIVRDSNLPDELRLHLLALRVARGLDNPESLTNFYKEASFDGREKQAEPMAAYSDIKGWRRAAYLYKAAGAAAPETRSPIIAEALALRDDYGLPALLPFTPFLDDAAPLGLPPESLRTGMRLYALAARKATPVWLETWDGIRGENRADQITDLAYKAATNTPVSITENKAESKVYGIFSDEARSQLVNMIKEKLDKTKKLHKYTDEVAYEKNLDLTSGEGYVMPLVSLIGDLEKAEEDRRLGEVVLLSSIALQGTPPEKINAGLLHKAMHGFETVGLTKEARELAMEAVLGMDNKKEN
jgi:hypothetical protein